MKLYEIFIILRPQLKEEEVNSFVQDLEQRLSQEGAEIKKREIKLNEELAYSIKKEKFGNVIRIDVSVPAEKDIAKVAKEHTITNENIFRLLTFVKPEIEEKKVTVMDQIRKKERRHPSETPVTVPSTQQVTEETVVREEADIKEIDKKIEELLQ